MELSDSLHGTIRQRLEFRGLIGTNSYRDMISYSKGRTVVLAAALIGVFIILFAAPLLFLLTHMS